MPSSSSRCSSAAIRRSRLDGAGVGLNSNGVAVAAAVLAPAEATTGRGNGGAGLAAAATAADTAAGAAGIAVGVGWQDADTGAFAAVELSPPNAWSVSAAVVSGGPAGAAVAAPQVTIVAGFA